MRQYQPTPDFYHDYIAHHGILGMSWGVRNGPPYPLGSDVSTGHRLKKGGSVTKKKPRIATSVSIMTKDIKKGDREFTKDQLDMLAKARLTEEAYKSPGFIQWLNETDPELKKYDPTKHEETVKRFRKETTPEFRREGENHVDTKQSKHEDVHTTLDSLHKDYKDKKITWDEYYDKNRELSEKAYKPVVEQQRNQIATKLASDMISDFLRWNKDGDKHNFFQIDGKTVSTAEMKNHLKKEVDMALDNANSFYTDKDGIFEFTLDGAPSYAEAAPLIVVYDSANKKVVDFYYA